MSGMIPHFGGLAALGTRGRGPNAVWEGLVRRNEVLSALCTLPVLLLQSMKRASVKAMRADPALRQAYGGYD